MRLDFTKMHGAGNDFIVFDAPAGRQLPTADQLRNLGDRRTGIGFDQALILEPPKRPGTLVFYRIFNSDGDEVEQCGNGARCIAALLARRGQVARGDVISMDSPAGLINARVCDGFVSVDMGVPSFDPRTLPFDASERADTYSLQVANERVEIGAVSMGNPHAVLTVPSVDTAPVERLGPAIEHHLRFPNRVNVGFMQVVDRSHIRLRVYERGAGETLACGTGACAAVAFGQRLGRLGPEVHVSMRGGELRVNCGMSPEAGEQESHLSRASRNEAYLPGGQKGPQAAFCNEHVWLTGPAEVSFEGHVEV